MKKINFVIIFILLNNSIFCDEIIEKWIYEDDGEHITLIFNENNRGEWQIKHTYQNNMFPVEYSTNEIIINNIYEKYEYFINGDELTARLVIISRFHQPKEYIFKRVVEYNASIVGTWTSTHANGRKVVIEFYSDNYGKYISLGYNPETTFEFSFIYNTDRIDIFGIIFDGSTIEYRAFRPEEKLNYFKIQGSTMIWSEGLSFFEEFIKLEN